MGIWGYRHAPEFISATAESWLTPGIAEKRKQDRDMTHAVSDAALRGVVPAADLEITWPAPERTPPLWKVFEHRKNIFRSSVQYGDSPTQLLDVWRRKDLPVEPAPVMVFIPGGAWVHGSRILQGYALMAHMVEAGWVCLSVDYRVSPNHLWPQHIIDVKAAIAWARANVDRFGGDRNFVALAGASAGGHLAALAGLTPNDPELQPGLLEGSDTSVDAVVGIYGRYCWEDRSTVERARFVDFPALNHLCHSGRTGPQLRRTVAVGLEVRGQLHGTPRCRSCLRYDRWSTHRCDGDRNRPVSQPHSS